MSSAETGRNSRAGVDGRFAMWAAHAIRACLHVACPHGARVHAGAPHTIGP